MNDELHLSGKARDVAAAIDDRAQPIELSRPDAVAAPGWGWLPALSLIGAVGLLLVALANTLSRAGSGQSDLLLWLGTLMLIVPIAARLVSSTPSRRERISLVVLIVVGLYMVKVLYSPMEFIYSDELIHVHNANSILQSGQLFNSNTILPVTPLYPGLETVTAALASVSGLSTFSAGIIIIGVARVILGLALFLLYEAVGGSPRVASLGALLYTTNANFLYWSAQFSYESLALPLAILVLLVGLRRAEAHDRAQRIGLAVIAMVGITAIVITHHLTSYFVAAFFIVWTLVNVFLRLRSKPSDVGARAIGVRSVSSLAVLAAFSALAALIWLVTEASYTVSYLSPVLGSAIDSIVKIISGEAGARQLFQSTGGYVAPVWERLTGIGAVLLMLLGLPIGLRIVWRRLRHHPVALMFAGAAAAYFAMLGLRLSPAAWETGNRASEFLFIGLAFVLAFAGVELWNARRRPRLSRAVALGSVAVIFVGGVIAGWSPDLRLARPLQVDVDGATIRPQGFAAAQWMGSVLGPNHIVGTDESNARLLQAYGQQQAYTGSYPDIKDVLNLPEFPNWQIKLIQDNDFQYLEVDRRLISWNNMQGFYFDETSGQPLPSTELLDPKVYGKFDRVPNVNRLYDSGNIVIYDTQAIINAATTK